MERQTRQKQAVLRSLVESGRSLAPAEILELARGEVPTLNLSTVYRQLRTLHDEAQVVKVDLPGQAARFEAPCTHTHAHARGHTEHHHHHFHCVACDRVFPIHGCPGGIDRLAPAGFHVEQHELTLRGHCADCAKGAR
jgi:Fur family transcriptional regulator, ferric uptake regulator